MASKTIIIVGGVAGGAACAARLRRLDEHARIVVFERGGEVSFANCGLPYHLGGVIPDRQQLLLMTPAAFRERLEVEVQVHHEVVAIDRVKREVVVRNLVDGRERRQGYDVLVLAPGAEPIRPPIPGLDHPRVRTLRSLADLDALMGLIGTARQAAVIGGGYIGLEVAENLRHRGLAVTIIELAAQVLGPADPEIAAVLQRELSTQGVGLRLETSVQRVEPLGEGLRLVLSDGTSLDSDLVVLAIGVRPETTLARAAGLQLGPRGGIRVDTDLKTSDPAIWAVGDAVEVVDTGTGAPALIPLAGPAARQGRLAAAAICGRPAHYGGTQGTAVCKVFNLTVAMTGLSEKAARRAGLPFRKVYVHPLDHAEYYPGAARMLLKLLHDAGGRVLGAQAVGTAGVDKRIDVLALAVRHGLNVRDLAEAELCYAPPYGSAKDALNYAGMVAVNVLDGDLVLCQPEEVASLDPARTCCLDVATAEEFRTFSLPGAINIPIDALRQRLGELPHDRELVVCCATGQRSYLACRILTAHGFRCRNLVGGLRLLRLFQPFQGSRQAAPATGVAGSRPAPSGPSPAAPLAATLSVDACGLQCPGPILKLKEAMDRLQPEQILAITATDPGFLNDLPAWCQATGHVLLDQSAQNGRYQARIRKTAAASEVLARCEMTSAVGRGLTIVCFNNDFDRMMAAFIIANGARAMGLPATLFFTFWGINVLRRQDPPLMNKNLIERMFGWMMPCGARKLALSKMHMLGLGKAMIEGIMRQHRVTSLPELIASAQATGVRLVVCTMSMGLMGIRKEELIDGVEEGGVAQYLGTAAAGNVNLFI